MQQYLFGLTFGFTGNKILQSSKAVLYVQSVLVTFGAFLVVRKFIRNILNRHLIDKSEHKCIIVSNSHIKVTWIIDEIKFTLHCNTVTTETVDLHFVYKSH